MGRCLVAELISLHFGPVGHSPSSPGARDPAQEEGDDAGLARDVHSEPGTGGNVLYEALHPAGPLQERQELLALLQLASHVAHPVRWCVLLVMQSLSSLLSLLLGLQKLVVLATALVIARSVSHYSGETLANKCLSNVDATNHNGATVLLREASLTRLCSRSLHIIYSHLNLMTNQFLPEELPGLKHEGYVIEWPEVGPPLSTAVSIFWPWWPYAGQVELPHLPTCFDHQSVAVHHLHHLPSELSLLVREGVLRGLVLPPNPHPLLLGSLLSVAILLGTPGHLRYAPVNTFGHSLLEQGLSNVASRVDDGPYQGGDLVHRVVAVRLQHHLHVALEQPRLREEMSLNSKRLTHLSNVASR